MSQDNWLDKLSALRETMPSDEMPVEEPATIAEDDACAQRGRLDIIFERKGRAGKCATIVSGFTIDNEAVADIASAMKRALGTGGSARGGEILVQGDRRQDVLRYLTSKGFKARVI